MLQVPAGRTLTGMDAALAALKEAALYHNAALGAIRRFLAGEAHHGVLANLAVNVHRLAAVQGGLGAQFDQWQAGAVPELHSVMASLKQTVAQTDGHLHQAGAAIQALVGEEFWNAARVTVFGTGAAAVPTVAGTPQAT